MRQSMLSEEQAQFLREEKEALSEIRLALAELDVPRESLTTLQEAILQLDELFLLVWWANSMPGRARWSMPCWAKRSCQREQRLPPRASHS